ncbi:MAG: hypothetical protein J6Z28_04235, partial [Succinivibrio sp.]|nr:hypothetical protein [Succinivibrio sp.]
ILYVADLPRETTNEDLSKLFKDYHFQFANLNNFKNNMTWSNHLIKTCYNLQSWTEVEKQNRHA